MADTRRATKRRLAFDTLDERVVPATFGFGLTAAGPVALTPVVQTLALPGATSLGLNRFGLSAGTLSSPVALNQAAAIIGTGGAATPAFQNFSIAQPFATPGGLGVNQAMTLNGGVLSNNTALTNALLNNNALLSNNAGTLVNTTANPLFGTGTSSLVTLPGSLRSLNTVLNAGIVPTLTDNDFRQVITSFGTAPNGQRFAAFNATPVNFSRTFLNSAAATPLSIVPTLTDNDFRQVITNFGTAPNGQRFAVFNAGLTALTPSAGGAPLFDLRPGIGTLPFFPGFQIGTGSQPGFPNPALGTGSNPRFPSFQIGTGPLPVFPNFQFGTGTNPFGTRFVP